MSVIVEAAFLMTAESAKRRGPILLVRRLGRLEIINADFFPAVEPPTWAQYKEVECGNWRNLAFPEQRLPGAASCLL